MATTTNPAGKIFWKLEVDYTRIPHISQEFVAVMEAGYELNSDQQERCTREVYAIAEMIRERAPRRPVGGDGVIHVDYGEPSRDSPRLSKSQVNGDEYGVPGGC
jgi:hypothetical protein